MFTPPMKPAESDRLRPVTSRQNALVKELRRAFQQGEPTPDGYVAIESVRIIEEAIRSGLRFKAAFFRFSAKQLAERLLPQITSQAETLVLPDEVFQSAVATDSPQGVAALVRIREHKLEEVLAHHQVLAVVSAGIQDPGNLGTLIRSAEAFGATAVLLGPGTVSQFNSKVVRASAGSIFRLPVIPVEYGACLDKLKQAQVKLLATSSHKGNPLGEADLTGAVAVFIGNEGAGLPREVAQKMDEVLAIPHSSRVESLNAGIAGSIVLYEAARQRGL